MFKISTHHASKIAYMLSRHSLHDVALLQYQQGYHKNRPIADKKFPVSRIEKVWGVEWLKKFTRTYVITMYHIPLIHNPLTMTPKKEESITTHS